MQDGVGHLSVHIGQSVLKLSIVLVSHLISLMID